MKSSGKLELSPFILFGGIRVKVTSADPVIALPLVKLCKSNTIGSLTTCNIGWYHAYMARYIPAWQNTWYAWKCSIFLLSYTQESLWVWRPKSMHWAIKLIYVSNVQWVYFFMVFIFRLFIFKEYSALYMGSLFQHWQKLNIARNTLFWNLPQKFLVLFTDKNSFFLFFYNH